MTAKRTVVVAGSGNAGLVTAISAAEAGAVVVVIDAAPEPAMGGNSRYTFAGFRFGFLHPDEVLALVPGLTDDERALVRSRGYTPDDYVRTLSTLSRGEADPALCRLLANQSLSVLQWMQKQGVEWNLRIWGIAPEPMWAGSPGNVYACGRGPGLVAALRRRAEAVGVSFRYAHSLEGIRTDDDGVRAVVARTECGPVEIPCRAVVAACGGFEANADLRRQHLGEAWAGMKVRGTAYNQGRGFDALWAIGGQPAGAWGHGHAVPVVADAPPVGDLRLGETTRRCLFQYGVSVDRQAHRFMDEGADRKTFMYSTTGLAVASQPGGVAYQVFDARFESANFEREFYLAGQIEKADTLAELAEKVGLPPADLVAEVEQYNTAVTEDTRFDPATLDGSAAPGLTPPRSNYAARLVRPPFYAVPVCGGMTFTFGGVRIDDRCRVVKADGRSIPGVYAAGEAAGGFFAHTYPANAGLMRGAVTGRMAGLGAAAHIHQEEAAS